MRMRMKGIMNVVLSFALMDAAMAQAKPAADPCAAAAGARFDVVSVKPMEKTGVGWSYDNTADRYSYYGPVIRMVQDAYGVRAPQIVGAPEWMRSATWQIEGKIEPPDDDAKMTDEAARAAWSARRIERIRGMLADRFGFRCHTETQQMPVYNLVVAKGGPKIEPAAGAADVADYAIHDSRSQMRIVAHVIDMALVTKVLSDSLGRPVIDRTGLTGKYKMDVSWAKEGRVASDAAVDNGASIFTAVQEQLGLRLEAAKGPVQVIVIDSVEKPDGN